LELQIFAGFKCSKFANIIGRLEITFFLQITKCLYLAFSETNEGLNIDNSGCLDMSDFSVKDAWKTY